MVAGQSCIAGPSVFLPRATLNCPARYTFLRLACTQMIPIDPACWRRGSQASFNVCKPMHRVSGYGLAGERKLRLRSCQATYQFPHVTLVACREQAFLCFQKHYAWRFSRRNHL